MITTEELEKLNEDWKNLPEQTNRLVSYINYLEYQLAVLEAQFDRKERNETF